MTFFLITRHPGAFSGYFLPSNTFRRMPARGNPSQVAARWSHHSNRTCIYLLHNVTTIYWMVWEVSGQISAKKNSKKILIYRNQKTKSIPLNAASNGQELSEEWSNVTLSLGGCCQMLPAHHAPSGLMGIRTSFLGTCSFPSRRQQHGGFPLAFGVLTGE